MEADYTFFYIEANVVCIMIFAMFLFREMHTVGRQAKQMAFVNITVCHILYFVSDIVWVLIVGGYIPQNRFTISTANTLNAILLSAITGFWFVYVELSQGERYITTFKGRIFALVPAMFETVMMVFMFIFLPGVMIDSENELKPVYFVLFLVVPALYISVSAVRSFIRAMRKENFAVRSQYLACAIYPVIITVFGIIQTVWLEAPFFCFGCTIMMTYVYIISLNDQVSLDELTRLNNRTQLKRYIVSESVKQNTDKTMRYILMIDLNKFKGINDQHGHVEGDNALRRTAEALKIACANNNLRTFIARYGGDEFIVITKTDNEEKIKELCSKIKATLIRLNDEAGAKYELTASIGYSSYSGDISAFQTALSEADEALYKDKQTRA